MGLPVPHPPRRPRPPWHSINTLWLAPGVRIDKVMAAFLSDLRHSLRMLRKSPLFASVAIASLALGLGANTAIFSLLDQALLRPLPVQKPHELVLLTSPGVVRGSFEGDDSDRLFSRPEYLDLRDRNQVFSGLIARAPVSANLVYQGSSEAVSAELVSGNYFDVLGIRPQLGRLLSAPDGLIKNAHPVVVLGYGYWMRRFGGSSNIVNQAVRINSSLMTVTGVAPRQFFGVDVGRVPDIYVPLAMKTAVTPTVDGYDDRSYHFLHIMARLKPGVTIQQANASLQVLFKPMLRADLAVMTGNISQKFRERFLAKAMVLEPAYNGVPTFRENVGTPMYISMAMVGLVLLIACANVANLLVARGLGRQKEIAVRLALGASRKDVMRQLLAESLLLAILGGVAGLLVSLWTSGVLVASMPGTSGGIPGLNASLDPRTVAFTFVLALVTGVGFGLLPALQSTRPNMYPTLKDQGSSVIGGFGQIRSRQALVIAQVALSLLLLVGAGLFTRSLMNLRKLDPGFRTANLVVFSIDASRNGYSQARVHQLYEEIQQRLASVPGVASASLSEIVPLSGDNNQSSIQVQGYEPKTDENMQPNFDQVSPGYFRTMGIPLLLGRDFAPQDKLGAHQVAVVNETFVKRFLGTGNPLGRRFGYHGQGPADVEIVGVVKDAKYRTLRDEKTTFVYVPYQQDDALSHISANVRTLAPPQALMPALRHEMANIDSNLAIWDLKPWSRR
jgi:predicted permease